jgi:hypothetical protein
LAPKPLPCWPLPCSRWLGPTPSAPRPSPLPAPSHVGRAAPRERAQPAPAQAIPSAPSTSTALRRHYADHYRPSTREAWGRFPDVDIGPRQPVAYTTELGRFRCPSGNPPLIKTRRNARLLPPLSRSSGGLVNGCSGANPVARMQWQQRRLVRQLTDARPPRHI